MNPSSGPSDHLLPQGEKGTKSIAGPATHSVPPSPLAGEGARRAGEGTLPERQVKSPPRLKKFARTLRRNQTAPEQRLWRILRNRRFADFKFRRQVPIGPYIADFACLGARLIIELDGSQHAQSVRDTIRDQWFFNDGYRVLRIWNNELSTQHDAVLEAIWTALQEAST